MSFLARRAVGASVRIAARQQQPRVASFRSSSVRFNSTATPPPPPPAGKSGSTALYVSIALAAAAGGGYWLYSSESDGARTVKTTAKENAQVAKSLTGFVPSKEDYQKVYNKVADILEAGDYDGTFTRLHETLS